MIFIVIVVLILGLIQALICGFEPYWFSMDGAETQHWKYIKPYAKAVRKVKKNAGVDLDALFPEDGEFSVLGMSAGNGGVVSVTVDRPAIVCVFAPDQVKWDLFGLLWMDIPDYAAMSKDSTFNIFVRSLDTFAETSRVTSRVIECSELNPDLYPPDEPIGDSGFFFGESHAIDASYRIEYRNMAIELLLSAIAPDQRKDALIERFDAAANGVAERLGTMDVKT